MHLALSLPREVSMPDPIGRVVRPRLSACVAMKSVPCTSAASSRRCKALKLPSPKWPNSVFTPPGSASRRPWKKRTGFVSTDCTRWYSRADPRTSVFTTIMQGRITASSAAGVRRCLSLGSRRRCSGANISAMMLAESTVP